MGDFLHRTTKQYLKSVSPQSLPEPIGNYIERPVVPDAPSKYWTITGDTVSLMSRAEQDAVDAAAEKARLDSAESEAITPMTEVLLSKLNALETRAGVRETTVTDLKAAVRGKL